MSRPSSLCCLAVLALTACGPAAGPALVSRATASSGTLTAELLSVAPLQVGYNRLSYRLASGGAAVTSATLAQKPLMTMTSMSHACPTLDPAATADEAGLFEGAIVFNMPSSESEHWDLALEVTPRGAATATTVTFAQLAVADSNARKMVGTGATSTLVTLSFPAGGARVGSNEVAVTAHRAADMTKMTWLPVTDLAFAVTPEMPSMGHGSSGNVNPQHQGQGLYTGTVNFSMSGDWVVHLDVTGGDGASLGRLDFSYAL